ncbi:S8 family serine peptidase [Sporanaerobacter acetigenes]|uniref:S8 family serine peptidase n=1 Tax=Sporanaerobacter acetigenes TaxID=165813 RepID=UPI001048817B|nr:S8 family serine peptidase [Sporanaerobacter acetigenes]
MRKHIALLLAMLLIIGSFNMAFAERAYKPIKLENINSSEDKNKEVRVIVELKDEPVISHSQGEKYTRMSETAINRIEKNLIDTQKYVEKDLSEKNIKMDYINSFTVAFNGFSGTVKKDDIEAIKRNSNVKNVYIANRYERPIVTPDMNSSYEMIGNRSIWGVDGYNGEGMVVAIIDTGIDPNHPDMKITNEIPKLTKESVEGKINSENLPGKFYTDKIPYGYNYFDMNDTITDTDPAPHGMHVAGTVAANGNILGVAPEAQLLAMKVFSNDPDFPSTYDDVYMAAIEDAVKLGVDVINMSLGAPASFYVSESPIDKMITEARKSGVLFAVSAGNEAHALNGILPGTIAEHPDFGMVGSPSLNKDTISVASVENLKITLPQLEAEIGQEDPISIPYNHAGDSPDPVEVFKDKEVEVVYVGTGESSFYDGKDVSGKIVLAVRTGSYYYSQIKETAQEKGAAGVLVRGAEGHGDYVNMNIGNPPHTIPMASLSQANGNMLEAKLKEGKMVKVSFKGEKGQVPNVDAGKISSFSSWGTTPTLDMKPEITAPGGQIYSTLNGDSYGTMSGTSMAAPHVTGGTALVLEYVNRNFENLSPEEKTAFAKRLLMNTAEPIIEEKNNDYQSGERNEYSPRLQGAGLMRVDKAVKTPVTVVNTSNCEAKIELRDFTNDNITMNLKAYNHSNEDVKYTVETKVLMNNIAFGFLNTLDCIKIQGALVGGDSEITVPANGSEDITVTIDLANAELDENIFVEGFIYLKPETTEYPQLVVPYVGFYGDWAGKKSPRVLDYEKFDEDNTVWEVTGMLGNKDDYLGFDDEEGYEGWKDRIAISPNNEGAYQNIMPVLTFMRNAEVAEFNILNEREQVVKKLYTDHWISKTHARNPMYYEANTLWDGTAYKQAVEDGKYYYQIKVKPQYTNAEWQEWRVPVLVDTKIPEITEIKYDKDTKVLTWKANDEGIGLNYFTFYKIVKDENDKLLRVPVTKKVKDKDGNEKEIELTVSAKKANENGEYNLNLSSYGAFVNFVVVAHDYAENTKEAVAYPATTFKLESPEPFALFGEKKVLLSGIAAGYKEVKVTITQDGIAPIELTIPVDQTTGKFSEMVELNSDGIFRINVATIDQEGKETKDLVPNRIFYVDTTAPEILETSSNVVRSKYIKDLTAEEALNSAVLLGGGRTVIFVEDGIGYAYDRELIKGDILERFNRATEKYVKLADGIFIDKDGYLTEELPAVKYFEDKLVATIRVHVKENFGEFDIYANGQYMDKYGELSLLNPSEFNDWVEFELELLPDTKTVEIKVFDTLRHEAVKTIVLDIDNPIDEEARVVEIKDIEVQAQVGEEYILPTEIKALLSNGSTKMVPVVWTAPKGIEIVDGKVTIGEEGTYVFTANVEGYGEVKLTLEVELTEVQKALKEVNEASADNDYEAVKQAIEENAGILGLDLTVYNQLAPEGRKHAVANDVYNNKPEGGYDLETLQSTFAEIVETRKVFQESVAIFSAASSENPLEDIEYITMLIENLKEVSYEKHSGRDIQEDILPELNGLVTDFNELTEEQRTQVLSTIDYTKNSSSTATRNALRVAIDAVKAKKQENDMTEGE